MFFLKSLCCCCFVLWALIQFNKWAKTIVAFGQSWLSFPRPHRLYIIPHDMMSKQPAIKWSTTSLVSICWTYKSWAPYKSLVKHIKKTKADKMLEPNSQPNFNSVVKLELFSFAGKFSSFGVKWHLVHTKATKWAMHVSVCVRIILSLCVFASHAWHSNYLSALAVARLLFLSRLTLWR